MCVRQHPRAGAHARRHVPHARPRRIGIPIHDAVGIHARHEVVCNAARGVQEAWLARELVHAGVAVQRPGLAAAPRALVRVALVSDAVADRTCVWVVVDEVVRRVVGRADVVFQRRVRVCCFIH
jgi:hypothetical protein